VHGPVTNKKHSTRTHGIRRRSKSGRTFFVKKIILMRHGKPLLVRTRWIAPYEMELWIRHYNLSDAVADGIPPSSMKLANSAAAIVASTAPRALSLVQALGHNATVADVVFREAELPFACWRFPRLPPPVWAGFFRMLWFFGYSRGSDSIQVTRSRARTAARKLVVLAETGPVLLVGHGIMNGLIAEELIALGWAGPKKQLSRYWSANIYGIQS
jgi:broad specificity phosphatase PhoE